MKKNTALFLLLVLILTFAGCQSDSGQESSSEAAQSQSQLEEEEEETPLPITYTLPDDYTAQGSGNHTTWTFDGQQDRITIEVNLFDDEMILDAMSSALETGSFDSLAQALGEAAGDAEFNLLHTDGLDVIYLIGREGEETILRYLLQAGEFVVDLRGKSTPEAVGLLQRHLEDVMATIEVEGVALVSTQSPDAQKDEGGQVDMDAEDAQQQPEG